MPKNSMGRGHLQKWADKEIAFDGGTMESKRFAKKESRKRNRQKAKFKTNEY
jgi:hypothetical protein